MPRFRVDLQDRTIQLSLSGQSKTEAVQLSDFEARDLMFALGEALHRRIAANYAGKHWTLWKPLFYMGNPGYLTGIANDGRPYVIIHGGPLPPFQMVFTDEAAIDLAKGLNEIATTPQDVRTAPKQ